MKSKKIASLVVAMMFALLTAGLAFAGQGPEVVVLKARKGNVHFPHWKHQATLKCGVCHHRMGPDGKQLPYEKGQQIKKCDDCHNKSLPNKSLNKPMKVFHKRCKGCHKHEKKGPTRCSGCHKK